MALRPSLHAAVVAGLAAVAVVGGVVWWWGHGVADDPVVRVVAEAPGGVPVAGGLADAGPGATSLPVGIELAALDGTGVELTSLTGRPLVVNLWFSSCLPCRTEMPEFQQVAVDLAGRVDIVGINPFDEAAEVESFTAEIGVDYPQYLDPDGAVLDALGIATFPTTILVRADGTIAHVNLGVLDADGLRELIAAELGVR